MPVVLPPQTEEAKAFRRAYGENSFWCGTLLAGCGGQLMIRIPTGKVAHFAHHPQHDGEPLVCHRTAVNAGSADHLYIKAGLTNWLTSQGQPATATLPTEQASVGSTVEIRLTSGTLIRIHLDNQVEPVWNEDVITILSADVPVPPALLAGCRYIHRIRCESDGSTRRVLLGTELPWRGTRWYDLTSCTFTLQRLVTPATTEADERARAKAAAPAPRRQPLPLPAPVRSVADPRTAAVDPKYQQAALRAAADLDAARAAQDRERVSALLTTAERISQTVKGTELARLLKAMTNSRSWLASAQQRMDPHERKQLSKRLQAFARLRTALASGNGVRLISAYKAARALSTPPLSAAEHEMLSEAAYRIDQPVPVRAPTEKSKSPKPTAVTAPVAPARKSRKGKKPKGRQNTESRWSPPPPPPAIPGTGPLAPTFLSQAAPQPAAPPSRASQSTFMAPAPTAPAPQPATEPAAHAEIIRLTQNLRAAMDRNDLPTLARLCDQAATRNTDHGPAGRELRLVLAGARSRLKHPQKSAAVDRVRSGLASLTKHGDTLAPDQLAASVADLNRHAALAGSMLPAYDRSALSSWSARIAARR
ncbi:competence protein CoiA family protein [Streptomyces sp. NRRL F-2890]|uniref:competence protein CoiA family protein n=1 Tax=Streptomyces sp. NRRL F-2890 TaxID=1463845 RepID=UPI00131A5692|nr:competence protein CoiA family protein [Streptomyces sp. NRRL F-2890]